MKMGELSGAAAERRQSMIREAAYFRAQRRGFVGGNAVDDWLEAEAEVDHMLDEEAARGSSDGLGPIEQFEAQLAALDQEMRRLVGKARQRGLRDPDRDRERAGEAAAAARQCRKKARRLRERSAEAWDEMKKGVHGARHD